MSLWTEKWFVWSIKASYCETILDHSSLMESMIIASSIVTWEQRHIVSPQMVALKRHRSTTPIELELIRRVRLTVILKQYRLDFVPQNFIGGRPIITGFSWLDIVLLAGWNAFILAYNWVQTSDPIDDNPEHSFVLRAKNAMRRFMRGFINFVYRPTNENEMADDPYRFNIGNLMILLFIRTFFAWIHTVFSEILYTVAIRRILSSVCRL